MRDQQRSDAGCFCLIPPHSVCTTHNLKSRDRRLNSKFKVDAPVLAVLFFFCRCCNQIAAGILISVEHFSYFRCETRAGWAGAVNEQRSCGDCLQFYFSLVIIRRFCSFCAICHLVAWKVAGDNEHMNYSGQKLPGISCVSTFSAYFFFFLSDDHDVDADAADGVVSCFANFR